MQTPNNPNNYPYQNQMSNPYPNAYQNQMASPYPNTYPNQKPKSNGAKLAIIISSIVGGILFLIVIAVCVGIYFLVEAYNVECVEIVKMNTYETGEYPYTTYEEAFENFFTDTSWTYYDGKNWSDMVEFKGTADFSDIQGEVIVGFQVDYMEDTCKIVYSKYQGEAMDKEDMDFLVSLAFYLYETENKSF